MNIIIYEDYYAENFEPISLTRPIFDIRYGENTLLDRIKKICPNDNLGLWVRDHLFDLVRETHPKLHVNRMPKEETLWLNARVLWTDEMITEIRKSPAMSFLDGDECIGAHLSGPVSVEWLHAGGPLSVFPPDEEIRHFNGSTVFHFLWDFLSRIPDAIADINLKSSKKKEMVSVILDETNGPIIIHDSATIEPFTYLQGPLYIGENCTVMSHSKVKNSILGPGCKIGGEVSGTIIQGNSNKAHDGFLGDSFLGEWVNLGAGTTNSNLKNNYQHVSMSVNGVEEMSTRLFLGCFMGDHTKTSIGTLLNTGTNIGVGCNVLAQSFPKRVIPSFTFCVQGKHRKMDFDHFIETAVTVKNRRKLGISTAEKKLLKLIYLSR